MCVKTNIAEKYFRIRLQINYFLMEKFKKICNYQGHPYLLWKSPNSVQIILFQSYLAHISAFYHRNIPQMNIVNQR